VRWRFLAWFSGIFKIDFNVPFPHSGLAVSEISSRPSVARFFTNRLYRWLAAYLLKVKATCKPTTPQQTIYFDRDIFLP
jgi:hypothetical protein